MGLPDSQGFAKGLTSVGEVGACGTGDQSREPSQEAMANHGWVQVTMQEQGERGAGVRSRQLRLLHRCLWSGPILVLLLHFALDVKW